MPLRINTNIPSMNVQRIGHINNRNLATRIERLSSGLRINRAADDASGLSVSEGMRGELSGLRQGARNTEHAVNLIQTAEGALNEVSAMLIRMRELAVQSASSTVNDDNREALNAEFVQLNNEIDRIAAVTSYNNSTLLSGYGNTVDNNAATSTALASPTTGVANVQLSSAQSGTYTFADTGTNDNQITLGNGVATQTIDIGSALDIDGAGSGVVATSSAIVANFDRLGIQLTLSGQKPADGSNPATDGYRDGDLDGSSLVINSGTGGTFQVGADNKVSDRIEVNIQDMRSAGAFLNTGSSSLSSLASSQAAITTLDVAITNVAQTRGDLGAYQNRLGFSLRNAENAIENNTASESSIRDADIAEEVSAFTQAQVLVQSGTSILAQANVLPQNALSLLQ
ncbi:MAG: flagellin [Candidatus Latescibacteria bacterium]|nr:flagellin [Candidatus Latescibacterota bacterium]MBT4139703.1 flagellin [Candidatus Latescibacterota bacterium]